MYLWVFQGNLGEGKTFGMSTFAHYFANKARRSHVDIKLFSNYGLKGASDIINYKDFYALAEAQGSICCLDEAHTSLDARLFAKGSNIYFTQFIFYLRKLKSSWFLSSPNIMNLDSRVRMLTNILVNCHKTPAGFNFEFYDFQAQSYGPYGKLLRRKFLPMVKAKEIFETGLYDTNKILRTIPFPSNEREFDKFLKTIIQINEGGGYLADTASAR